MLRCFTLSLLFPVITNGTVCNDATECDYRATSVLLSPPVANSIIPSNSVSVMESCEQISLYNLWSYLLYRWSIVLYFVPLIVIILCKCKIINCDVRLIYGNMPDDLV